MLLQIALTFLLTLAYTFATPPPGYQKKEEISTDKNVPKYNYGYKISDAKGSQEKQEQRDGIYAHGRYNVQGEDHHQSVEYLADDWGFHPFIEYSNQSPHSQSSTVIALGEEAVKALHSNNQKTTPSLTSGTSVQTETNTVHVTLTQNPHPTTQTTTKLSPIPKLQQNTILTTQILPAYQQTLISGADLNGNAEIKNHISTHSVQINHGTNEGTVNGGNDKGNHRQGRILNIKNQEDSKIELTTNGAKDLNEQSNPTENLILVNQEQYNDKVVLVNQDVSHGGVNVVQNNKQGNDNQNHKEGAGKVVLINHGVQEKVVEDQKSGNANQAIFIQENPLIQHDTHSNLAYPNFAGQPLLIQQDTHANLAYPNFAGNQIYQHTSAQLRKGGQYFSTQGNRYTSALGVQGQFGEGASLGFKNDGKYQAQFEHLDKTQQSQAEKLFNGVAHLENKVNEYAQKIAAQENHLRTQINSGSYQQRKENVKIINSEQLKKANNNLQAIYQNYNDDEDPYPYSGSYGARINPKFVQKTKTNENIRQSVQYVNTNVHNGYSSSNGYSSDHKTKSDIQNAYSSNDYISNEQVKTDDKNSYYNANQVKTSSNNYNSNQETNKNTYSTYNTNTDDQKASKLIENTKNLINSQDVLNINDILNHKAETKLTDTEVSNTHQVISETTEKNEVSLLKEPIVVEDLEENNINEEEYSTTRSTSETVAYKEKETTSSVTQKGVGTTFLAPITAGVKLEQEFSSANSEAENTKNEDETHSDFKSTVKVEGETGDYMSSQNLAGENLLSSQNSAAENLVSSQNTAGVNFLSSQNLAGVNFLSSQNPSTVNYLSSQNTAGVNLLSSQNSAGVNVLTSQNSAGVNVLSSQNSAGVHYLSSQDSAGVNYLSSQNSAGLNYLIAQNTLGTTANYLSSQNTLGETTNYLSSQNTVKAGETTNLFSTQSSSDLNLGEVSSNLNTGEISSQTVSTNNLGEITSQGLNTGETISQTSSEINSGKSTIQSDVTTSQDVKYSGREKYINSHALNVQEKVVAPTKSAVLVDIQKSVPFYIGRFEYVRGPDGLVVDKQVDETVVDSKENENFGQQLLQYTVEAIPRPTQVIQVENTESGQRENLIQIQHESLPTPEALIQQQPANTQSIELSSSTSSSEQNAQQELQSTQQSLYQNQLLEATASSTTAEEAEQSQTVNHQNTLNTQYKVHESTPHRLSYQVNHVATKSATAQNSHFESTNSVTKSTSTQDSKSSASLQEEFDKNQRYTNVKNGILATVQTPTSISTAPTSNPSSLVSTTSYQIHHESSNLPVKETHVHLDHTSHEGNKQIHENQQFLIQNQLLAENQQQSNSLQHGNQEQIVFHYNNGNQQNQGYLVPQVLLSKEHHVLIHNNQPVGETLPTPEALIKHESNVQNIQGSSSAVSSSSSTHEERVQGTQEQILIQEPQNVQKQDVLLKEQNQQHALLLPQNQVIVQQLQHPQGGQHQVYIQHEQQQNQQQVYVQHEQQNQQHVHLQHQISQEIEKQTQQQQQENQFQAHQQILQENAAVAAGIQQQIHLQDQLQHGSQENQQQTFLQHQHQQFLQENQQQAHLQEVSQENRQQVYQLQQQQQQQKQENQQLANFKEASQENRQEVYLQHQQQQVVQENQHLHEATKENQQQVYLQHQQQQALQENQHLLEATQENRQQVYLQHQQQQALQENQHLHEATQENRQQVYLQHQQQQVVQENQHLQEATQENRQQVYLQQQQVIQENQQQTHSQHKLQQTFQDNQQVGLQHQSQQVLQENQQKGEFFKQINSQVQDQQQQLLVQKNQLKDILLQNHEQSKEQTEQNGKVLLLPTSVIFQNGQQIQLQDNNGEQLFLLPTPQALVQTNTPPSEIVIQPLPSPQALTQQPDNNNHQVLVQQLPTPQALISHALIQHQGSNNNLDQKNEEGQLDYRVQQLIPQQGTLKQQGAQKLIPHLKQEGGNLVSHYSQNIIHARGEHGSEAHSHVQVTHPVTLESTQAPIFVTQSQQHATQVLINQQQNAQESQGYTVVNQNQGGVKEMSSFESQKLYPVIVDQGNQYNNAQAGKDTLTTTQYNLENNQGSHVQAQYEFKNNHGSTGAPQYQTTNNGLSTQSQYQAESTASEYQVQNNQVSHQQYQLQNSVSEKINSQNTREELTNAQTIQTHNTQTGSDSHAANEFYQHVQQLTPHLIDEGNAKSVNAEKVGDGKNIANKFPSKAVVNYGSGHQHQQIYLQEIQYPQELVHVTLPGYDPEKLVTRINVQLNDGREGVNGESGKLVQIQGLVNRQQGHQEHQQIRYQQEVQNHQQEQLTESQHKQEELTKIQHDVQQEQNDLQILSSQKSESTNTGNLINNKETIIEKVIEKKVPVPYIVEVPKPYPVQVTKLVPQPYPVTVTQTVKVPVPTPVEVKVPHPVPVEVPKYIERPYPIYVSQFNKDGEKQNFYINQENVKASWNLYNGLTEQQGGSPGMYAGVNFKSNKPQMYAPSYDGFNSYVPKGSNFYHTIHYNDYIGLTPPKFKSKGYHTISTQAYKNDKNIQGDKKYQNNENFANYQAASSNQNIHAQKHQSVLTHTTQGTLTHTNQGALTHTNQGAITHANQGALIHATQGALTHATQGALTHTNQGHLIHTNQGALTHTNQGASVHLINLQGTTSHGLNYQGAQTISLIPIKNQQIKTQNYQNTVTHPPNQQSLSTNSAQKHLGTTLIPTRPYHNHNGEKLSPTPSYQHTKQSASSLNHQSPYLPYTISQKQTPTAGTTKVPAHFQYNYARRYRNARHGFGNLRLEYGFKPPLIPSLEIDENGKPVEKIEDN